MGYGNNRFFSHTNPYISNVMQQCRCLPMLIFQAWATCVCTGKFSTLIFILPSKTLCSKFRWSSIKVDQCTGSEEKFFISVAKKNDCGRRQQCSLPHLQHQVLFVHSTKFIHCLDSVAVCPSWYFLLLFRLSLLILLASCQNSLCSWIFMYSVFQGKEFFSILNENHLQL